MAASKISLGAEAIATENYDITGTSTSRPGLSQLDVSTKVKGSSLDEKASTDHVLKDSDGVFNMGGGDDVFVFTTSANSHRTVAQLSTVNGIVDMGDGGNDIVFLTHSIEDFVYSLRADGGIKMQYAEGGANDPAITFYGAEKFSFLVGNERHVYTHDELQNIVNFQVSHPTPSTDIM